MLRGALGLVLVGTLGEISRRYRGDIGEVQGRYRGGTGEVKTHWVSFLSAHWPISHTPHEEGHLWYLAR